MKLIRLKELRPDVWEEAMRQTLKQCNLKFWSQLVEDDSSLTFAFALDNSDQKKDVWIAIDREEDFTLYDQWVASQSKQTEPQSKIDLEYWRWEYAGRAMQGTNMEMYANTFGNKWAEKVATDSVYMADTLIKELQKK